MKPKKCGKLDVSDLTGLDSKYSNNFEQSKQIGFKKIVIPLFFTKCIYSEMTVYTVKTEYTFTNTVKVK